MPIFSESYSCGKRWTVYVYFVEKDQHPPKTICNRFCQRLDTFPWKPNFSFYFFFLFVERDDSPVFVSISSTHHMLSRGFQVSILNWKPQWWWCCGGICICWDSNLIIMDAFVRSQFWLRVGKWNWTLPILILLLQWFCVCARILLLIFGWSV